MTALTKALLLTAAANLAALHGAAAQDLIIDDELFLAEAPMNAAELREARGGFRVGDLEFDITVNVTPVTATPLPPGGLFGDGGVFGGGGVFNGEPPIAEDGLFGAGGVFGDGGVFGSGADQGPQTVSPGVVPTMAPPAGAAEAQAPASGVVAAPSPAPVVMAAPAALEPQVVASAPAPAASVMPQGPAPAPSPTAAPVAAPSQPVALVQQTPGAPQPAPASVQPAQPVQSAPPPQPSGQQPAVAAPPAAAPAGQPVQLSSGLRMTGAADQTRVVINNTLNDVIVRYTVDLDIAVSNFAAQTGVANISGVATQGIMTQSLLGSLR